MNKVLFTFTAFTIVLMSILIGVISFYEGEQSGKKHQTAPQTTMIPNPASTNCLKIGGSLSMQKNGKGGEYGLCDFGSGYACEEWALFRGDCPKYGVKTTGYDTIEQKYCAWLGGKTLAVPNAKCSFTDGSVCTDLALYNGQCYKGQ